MGDLPSIYEKICQENLVKYGTHSSKVMQIIIGEYSDRTHFIYEILQNAEDAGATFIQFHLEKDKLTLVHNGRPFDEADLAGVCGIADGTKEDGTRIGHFGIGFKSVYAYTNTPIIISGDFAFRIEQYIYPREENTAVTDPGLTYMILPFNKSGVSKTTAFAEISDAFSNKICAETLLMLQNVSDIHIEIEGRSSTIELNKASKSIKQSGRAKKLILTTNIISQNRTINRKKEFISFTENKKKTCALVFAVEDNRLQRVENSFIYSYFPTSRKAHQYFYIHAPFDTTPARDNFREGKEFGKNNIQLVDRLCNLLGTAFSWLQGNGYLKNNGFEKVYPCYKYESNDLFFPIYQKAINLIKNKEILVPVDGEQELSEISNVVIPADIRMKTIIGNDDLFELLHKKLFWLKDLSDDKSVLDLHYFLINTFDIPVYSWNRIIPYLTAEYLEKQTVNWLGSFIYAARNLWNGKYADLSLFQQLPLVRLKNGQHILAYANGFPQVYLNNPAAAEYKISDKCLKNPTIRNFYEGVLKIPEFSPEREVKDRIIPKYSRNIIAFRTKNEMHENIMDLGIIKDALAENVRLIEELKDCFLLYDGKMWRKPSELCLPSDNYSDGYALLAGNDKYPIYFISNRYFGKTDTEYITEDFLIQLGCHKGLFPVPVEKELFVETYLKCVSDNTETLNYYKSLFSKKYWSKDSEWQTTFYGFSSILQDVSREESLAIAAFLNAHKEDCPLTTEVVFADDGRSRSNGTSVTIYTMLGLQLAYSEWIWGKGKRRPSRPLDLDQDDLMTGYYEYPELLDWLPLKKRNSALSAWLEENFEDIGERDLIKHMLSNTQEVAKLAKRFAHENARSHRKNHFSDLEKEFAAADRYQMQNGNYAFETFSISEKEIERRTQRLEETLRASMHEDSIVCKNLTFTCRTTSREEKVFLFAEYNGHCQICNEMILDYQGHPYFEAVNILRTNGFNDWKNKSVSLGWNSICLCPNCAAKYKYGSKKISSMISQIKQKTIMKDQDDLIGIEIEMPLGIKNIIRYTPRHFLALQSAIKVFENADALPEI